jgi:DNA-binding beta-propeller fold protein YncE
VATSKDGRLTAITTHEGTLYCLDRNGNPSWEYDCGSKITSVDCGMEGNVVIAALDTGSVVYLNDEGKVITKTDFASGITTVAIDSAGEISLVATGDNTLMCADDQGHVLWNAKFSAGVGDVAVTPSGDFIAVACDDSKVHAYDREGILRWKRDVRGTVTALDIVPKTSQIFACVREMGAVGMSKQGDELWMFSASEDLKRVSASRDGGSLALVDFSGDVMFLEFVDEEVEVFYEILCRGDAKCGTFVSAVYSPLCPRCGSEKNVVRIIKEKI